MWVHPVDQLKRASLFVTIIRMFPTSDRIVRTVSNSSIAGAATGLDVAHLYA